MIRAKVIVGVFIAGVLTLLATSVSAHEVRPAYLEVNEIKTGQFELFWKVPQRGDMRLHIIPVMPGACRDSIPAQQFVLSDAAVERRTVDCGKDGFINKSIVFEGLEATITDVLVRVSLLDSTVTTTLVRSNKPWMEIRGAQSVMEVASEYIVLGMGALLKRLPLAWPAWVQQSPTYVIGSLAAFWFIQRVAGFWL